ncbi:MAG: hypothetical protein DCC58_06505 [Chloroflexi bacterium]|nr:MAG: hypothetical protein DCC58_06505 [Chloroflexota bacterium]
MGVERFEVTGREPFAGGAAFGASGPYERIDGIVHFAVDPEHPANSAIIDLAAAPRGDDGLVRFSSDFCLLQPVDRRLAHGSLLIELPNRGRKLLPRMINRGLLDPVPGRNIPVGDGFLFRHGWSVGWIGWQWDVLRSPGLMGLQAPVINATGRTVVRFQVNAAHTTHLLADRVHQPYPAADVEEAGATLSVRWSATDEPEILPRDAWRFAREEGAGVEPHPDFIYLESGFQPGAIYELFYTTNRAPVVGCGLLAVRDIAPFLRSAADDNPAAGSIERAYAFGMSQTGRMLRHFLYLGLNRDEAGNPAYDGIIPHVGGARRGEFNHRFGQPSVQGTPGMGHRPPFDDAGLLARQRALGAVPKVIQTNTSAEYWRGDCALNHIDPDRGDLPPEPGTRNYHFAGTQHGPGAVPLTRDNPNDGGRGRYGFNAVDYSPLLRAVVMNLDAWVRDGIEPPPSKHPRLDDGSAVTRDDVLQRFATFTGIHLPDPAKLPVIRAIDLGPQVDDGIVTHPAREGAAYPAWVSSVDADGNELAGIRLPDLTTPVGTHTGWNPRAPETGAPEQILSMQGSTFFFAPDAATRTAAGDPRPSLAERYAGRDDYLARVKSAALALVSERYVLEEDIANVLSDAAARYDAALSAYSAFRTPGADIIERPRAGVAG